MYLLLRRQQLVVSLLLCFIACCRMSCLLFLEPDEFWLFAECLEKIPKTREGWGEGREGRGAEGRIENVCGPKIRAGDGIGDGYWCW